MTLEEIREQLKQLEVKHRLPTKEEGMGTVVPISPALADIEKSIKGFAQVKTPTIPPTKPAPTEPYLRRSFEAPLEKVGVMLRPDQGDLGSLFQETDAFLKQYEVIPTPEKSMFEKFISPAPAMTEMLQEFGPIGATRSDPAARRAREIVRVPPSHPLRLMSPPVQVFESIKDILPESAMTETEGKLGVLQRMAMAGNALAIAAIQALGAGKVLGPRPPKPGQIDLPLEGLPPRGPVKPAMAPEAVKPPVPKEQLPLPFKEPKKVKAELTPVQKEIEDIARAFEDIAPTPAPAKAVAKPKPTPKPPVTEAPPTKKVVGAAVESRLKSVVEKGGGKYRYVQEAYPDIDVPAQVVFDDPTSGTSLHLPLTATRKDVTKKLLESRQKYKAGLKEAAVAKVKAEPKPKAKLEKAAEVEPDIITKGIVARGGAKAKSIKVAKEAGKDVVKFETAKGEKFEVLRQKLTPEKVSRIVRGGLAERVAKTKKPKVKPLPKKVVVEPLQKGVPPEIKAKAAEAGIKSTKLKSRADKLIKDKLESKPMRVTEKSKAPVLKEFDEFHNLRLEADAQGMSVRYTPKTKQVELRAPVTGEKKVFPSLAKAWEYLNNEQGSIRPFSSEIVERLERVSKSGIKGAEAGGFDVGRKVLPMRAAFKSLSGRSIAARGREAVDRVDRLQTIFVRNYLDKKIKPIAAKKGFVTKEVVNPVQYKAVGEALEQGDKLGKVFSDWELLKMGLDKEGITAYKAVRKTADRVYTHVRKVYKETGRPIPAYRKGHMPHRWLGEWEIKVNGKKYVRSNGNSAFQQQGEAIGEAYQLMKDPKNVKVEIKYTGNKDIVNLPETAFIKAFNKIIKQIEKGGSMDAAQLREAFKKGKTPVGFGKHLAQRKGSPGYIPIADNWDSLTRGYATAAIRHAELAKFRHKVLSLAKRIDPNKTPDEWKRALRYVDAVSGVPGKTEMFLNATINYLPNKFGIEFFRPSLRTAARLNTITTHMKLGLLNVTFPAVNAYQNVVTTWPQFSRIMLQAGYSNAQAEKMFARAIATYNTAAARRVRVRMSRHGVLDPKFVRAELGTFKEKTGKEVAEKISLGLSAWTEHHNRSFAAWLRYNMARKLQKMNYKRTYKVSKDFVEEVHFRYDIADKPELFRGPVGGTLGIFRTFSSHMLYKMYQLGQAAKAGHVSPLLRFTGAMVVMGGVAGIPGVYLANEVMGKATGKYPLDTFYDEAPDWAKYGLLATLGIDVSRRVGVGDIFPDDVSDFKGATWSTIWNLFEGWRKPFETFTREVPAFKGPAALLREDYQDVVGKRERKIYTPTTKEKVAIGIGLRPVRASKIQAVGTEIYHKKKRYTELKARYVDDILEAQEAGDSAKVDKLRAKARKDGIRITSGDLRRERKKKKTMGLRRRYKPLPKDIKSRRLRERIRELGR